MNGGLTHRREAQDLWCTGLWEVQGFSAFFQRAVKGFPSFLHDLTILWFFRFLFPFGKCVSHLMTQTLIFSKILQYFPGFEKTAL